MAEDQRKKDVFTLNELDSLNRIFGSINEWVIGWEDDNSLVIRDLSFNVYDKDGAHVGSITNFDPKGDVQYEPDFKVGLGL